MIYTHLNRLSVLLALLATCLATAGVRAATIPEALLGEWVLNNERTHEIQPKQGGGFDGFGVTPSISVGGVPIPLPGAAATPSSGPVSDPRVLRCGRMQIEMQTPNVRLIYEGVGEEIMKPGNDLGRKTRLSRTKITQFYETNTRRVNKTFEVQKDGSLLVKVKLNPKGAKSVTQVRVFERP
ncbi:MAG: hypothetical protein KDI31_12705, partial [Pseudomonadales bacterium]|nr:hypothetical protein [Pseudomonadales bacterium]